MTYEKFKVSVVDYMHQHLDAAHKINIHPITKNNHVLLDGLTILEADCNISPTIYLNYYYDELLTGSKTLESIQKQILQTYLINRPEEKIDVSFFTNYENIRNRIAYKLINKKQNEELLKEIPHASYLDLALVFYCLVTTSIAGSATILIHNNHLQLWNVTAEALEVQARKNTPLLLKAEFLDMDHVLEDHVRQDVALPPEHSPMRILTNSKRLNGASCLLYPQLLDDAATKLNSDFYIIPSSIHEVLLLPAEPLYTVSELNEMVTEVNTSQVSTEEILSDHVYLYSRSMKRLLIPEVATT